jgi:hypothetical protein
MAAWALDIQDAGAAMLLAVILLLVTVWFGWKRHGVGRFRPVRRKPAGHDTQLRRNQRKPDWVIAEVLRLKALAPKLSCRDIAEIFDRRFAIARQMTVSKTWVHHILRKRKVEVLRLRSLSEILCARHTMTNPRSMYATQEESTGVDADRSCPEGAA